MKSLKIVTNTINNHLFTRNNKLAAWFRFIQWQISCRRFPNGIVMPFIENSFLLVKKNMHGATGNIYAGLQEPEEMMFLLHFLRKDELFIDIGSNIGSYTILAAKNVGAKVIAIEPVPQTFNCLSTNISLNGVQNLVCALQNGVGDTCGVLKFTSAYDTINHVVLDEEKSGEEYVDVEVKKLDDILAERHNECPVLMKIDVEGFEMNVIKGGRNTFSAPRLSALIIEINGCCRQYNVTELDIHREIVNSGFTPVRYDPMTRILTIADSFTPNGNTIYVRDVKSAQTKLNAAKKYRVLNRII